MIIDTSVRPLYQPSFDEFKAICEEHGLTRLETSSIRRFYFNRMLVVTYDFVLKYPIACNGLLDTIPRNITSENDLITYIEQSKRAIADLIETEATMNLLNQIEQL